jgi:hypothetical protein
VADEFLGAVIDVDGDLEEAAAVVGSAGDEEGSGAGGAGRDRDSAIVTARTSMRANPIRQTLPDRLR